MNLSKKLLVVLLSLTMTVSMFTACKPQGNVELDDPKSSFTETILSDETVKDIVPDYKGMVQEKEEQNPETVGWLGVPGTTINDVVVQSKKDNNYYLRLNFDLEYEFSGVYYADYRNSFVSGTREDLPVNTTIYGHALTDDPEHKNFDTKFGPLHKFRDLEFASEHPYLFFSTSEGDFVYEIVSVFLANADNPKNPYNKGDAEKGTFHDIVRDEIIPRSLYNYGVKITDDDKFLTLSTCLYVLEDGTLTNYPNTYYRYAITARLMDESEPIKEAIALKIDDSRIIDPPEKMSAAAK